MARAADLFLLSLGVRRKEIAIERKEKELSLMARGLKAVSNEGALSTIENMKKSFSFDRVKKTFACGENLLSLSPLRSLTFFSAGNL